MAVVLLSCRTCRVMCWCGEGASDSLPIPGCHGVQYATCHHGPQDYFSDIVHHSNTVLLPVLPRQGCQQQQPQWHHSQQLLELRVYDRIVRAVITSDLGKPQLDCGTVTIMQNAIQFVGQCCGKMRLRALPSTKSYDKTTRKNS